MSLAATLREALERGARGSPELLPGDPADPLTDEDQPVTPAAVLVALVDRPEPTILLTVRTAGLRNHSGQVAFPGGRIDPGDDGPVAAALREASEEIALPPAAVDVVGVTDRYRTITGYEVTPVIGIVPAGLPLAPHEPEVALIFEASLAHLIEPANQIVRTVLWQGRQRSYYEIMWDGQRIWGATAAMIVNLSRRLAFAR